ncbi:hypothetical protein K432DRAFT_379368 [Lepidopterella palustris CBS 459.81]|uniref:DNA polymerase delta subunit 3 n=1 Tax=Lepidopterella palustris CBS 459.81 TaxID=1314670 RepID=A0A8E2EGY1_9PEZI|nr:hypothetical protein K432DRAFT_379368 [Lepidopterella palustris CBS 459.81]
MDKYKDYLVANVLIDGKIITYRLLSRELKVHVNLAKQMLFDFHDKQNAKKPGTVHATYLITGTKRPGPSQHSNGIHSQDGEDSIMQSSPYMSSMPEQEEVTDVAEEVVPVTSIILCRQEELEETKAQLEEMTSIHVYSLEPGPLQNMNLISLCNQEIVKKFAHQDPMDNWKAYGTIHNPHVKRRATRRPPPIASEATTAPKSIAQTSSTVQPKEKDDVTAQTARGSQLAVAAKKTDAKATFKREKSDIFKSFAKANAKPKAKEAEKSKEYTPAIESAEQSAHEDEPMKDVSEDEYEEDYTPEVEISKEKNDAARKARAEREEKLRKMMDDDDDDDDDNDDVPMDDAPIAEEPKDAPIERQPQKAAESASVTVSGGRRRGKRRVTKKKTVRDEEGYLVTKEEAVWESFSEDEPEPKKLKTVAPTISTAKGKKGAKQGQGQGNIMSFFSKK